MAVEKGSFTRGSTGTATIVLDGSFTPNRFFFEIGPRTSTNETHAIRSQGGQDIANSRKSATSIYASATLHGTRESTSYAITHYKDVTGTLTKVISGSVTAVDVGEFDVNFDTVDSAYTIRFWCDDN